MGRTALVDLAGYMGILHVPVSIWSAIAECAAIYAGV